MEEKHAGDSAVGMSKGELKRPLKTMVCLCGCDIFLEACRVNENGRTLVPKPNIYVCTICKNRYNLEELKRLSK